MLFSSSLGNPKAFSGQMRYIIFSAGSGSTQGCPPRRVCTDSTHPGGMYMLPQLLSIWSSGSNPTRCSWPNVDPASLPYKISKGSNSLFNQTWNPLLETIKQTSHCSWFSFGAISLWPSNWWWGSMTSLHANNQEIAWSTFHVILLIIFSKEAESSYFIWI